MARLFARAQKLKKLLKNLLTNNNESAIISTVDTKGIDTHGSQERIIFNHRHRNSKQH